MADRPRRATTRKLSPKKISPLKKKTQKDSKKKHNPSAKLQKPVTPNKCVCEQCPCGKCLCKEEVRKYTTEKTPCAQSTTKKIEESKPDIPWIQCDICDQWWHLRCSGLVNKEGHQIECETFICIKCMFENSSLQPEFFCNKGQTENSQETSTCPKSIKSKKQETSEEKTISTTTKEDDQNLAHKKPEFIVIIDGIDHTFRTSIDILREIQKVYPEITPLHCYPLPKGGIAIHLETKEEEQTLLSEWPPGSFRTHRKVHPHKPKSISKKSVIVKPIQIDLSEDEIRDDLQSYYKADFKITRLKNPNSNKVFPLVKVETNIKVGQLLLNEGVVIKDRYYNCEPFVKDIPTRCYKCQKFGHIAKHCLNNLTCPRCSKSHHKFECTEETLKCANCNESHATYSRECKSLIAKQQALIQRRTVERQFRINHH